MTIGFRSRPRPQSFGLPTAGLWTGNNKFLLPDGKVILFTTAVGAGRIGERHSENIEPAEVVDAGKPAWPGDDRTLAVAVPWLKLSSWVGKRRPVGVGAEAVRVESCPAELLAGAQ